MKHFTYLPVIGNGPTIEGQGDDDMALEFMFWWLLRLGDRASVMEVDTRLITAAQQQADWLAANDFDKDNPHKGIDGTMPNERVRMAGYALPAWHGDGNTVESVTRTWDDFPEIVDDLMAHETHRDHMFCRGFWEPNTRYGIGCSDNYFVIITCPPETE